MSDKSTHSTVNPFNPASLRLKQGAGVAGVKKVRNRVPTRKPDKQDFFRVHPDEGYRMNLGIIEHKEDDTVYVVTAAIQEELLDLMQPVTLYTTVTRQGTVFLWPVKLPGEDGKDHDAWKSSREIAERATKSWVRMQWNPSVGAYDMFEATGISVEPDWPEESFEELLEIAFRGKIIENLDHLVIQKLRGEA